MRETRCSPPLLIGGGREAPEEAKACDASVNQLYVNNISNNNDTISHRYYPVIKMGNNRIWWEGFTTGDHTLGKLALYVLNLIKTLNVIMEKSDTDFTGVLTSTRSVLNSPLQIGPAR